MKKMRCIIAAILGIVLSVTASAESVEELVKRKEELIKALWYVEEWEEVVIPIGTYEIGKDIPEGKWTFWAYDYARPEIQYGSTLRPGGASMHATKDVEKDEKLTSEKLDYYDPRLDETYFDIYLENGKFLCVKYGTAIIQTENKDIDFAEEIDKSMLQMSADEIYNKISEIEKEIASCEEYISMDVECGTWKIGKDIAAGRYEVRPMGSTKTKIKYGPQNGNQNEIQAFEYFAKVELMETTSEGFSVSEGDTVEYITMENGNLFEIKNQQAVISTYKGKEPPCFLNRKEASEREKHVWKELNEEEQLQKSIEKLKRIIGD